MRSIKAGAAYFALVFAADFALPPAVAARLGTGIIAPGLWLAAEFSVVLKIRRLTLAQYSAGRNPVAGACASGWLTPGSICAGTRPEFLPYDWRPRARRPGRELPAICR
ncbi:MAG TPA: hypothetical protein VFJ52_10405, partial [Terriglobia bacterium]|nr:hypothetical protein [Terriglobia bacterium]